MKIKTMFIMCLMLSGLTKAQEPERKLYIANQVNGYDITIDGKLDEPAWQTVKWEDHFTQFQPHEGRPPHQQTEFALLYDEHNIYVAIKALDKNPDSISMRMTRRDVMDGDQVGVAFDTYLDRRTAYETFFEEKRPFFIEGKNILHYKLMFGDGDLASDGLFYSRRIGRRPHYSPD